jgi:vacuolar-type H+-ATPase subunit H
VSRRDRFRPSRSPAREASERIEAIVEAAERAAESVIDDAEERARGYLADAQREADRVAGERLASLSELTDTLLSQAEAIGRHTEALLAALEQAKAELDPNYRPARPAEPRRPARAAHLTAVAEPEDSGPLPADRDNFPSNGESEAPRPAPAGARLLATQMAVSGNSREEIALRLRNGFEIEDTTAILDAILGPED